MHRQQAMSGIHLTAATRMGKGKKKKGGGKAKAKARTKTASGSTGISNGVLAAAFIVCVAVGLGVWQGGAGQSGNTGGGGAGERKFGLSKEVELVVQGGPRVSESDHRARVVRQRRVRKEWIASQAKNEETGWVRRGPYYMLEDSEPLFDTVEVLSSVVAEGSAVRKAYGDKLVVLSEDPPMFQIDGFITPDECAHFIMWAHKMGLERSTTTGNIEDGKFVRPVSDVRTSSNAWCTGVCDKDAVLFRVSERISNVTRVPSTNGEHFQLLHYDVGQQYKEHHDYIFDQAKTPGGIRIITAFLYLNDVEEGGETNFPQLNLKVKPKQGRLVVWPNVLPGSYREDSRTEHAALPVLKGEKYGANAWIHSHDFKSPYEQGITG